MHDPVADMLSRIRNAQQAKHQEVSMMSSKLKEAIVKVLVEEGFLSSFEVNEINHFSKKLTLKLKYFQGKPVIEHLKRISRPGLRVYKGNNDLHGIPGFGLAILSTSQGVMTHTKAKSIGIGGEVLCEVA